MVLIIHVQLVQINVIQQKVFIVIIVSVNVIIQLNIGILIFKHAVTKFIFFIIISEKNNLEQRLNYTDQCVLDGDCIPTLICPILPGVCTCPTYLPDLVCNCADTKYYDSTLSQCGMNNI
jgi:hypothetical protein